MVFVGAEQSVKDSGEGWGRRGEVQEEGGREVSEAPIIGWCNVGQRTTDNDSKQFKQYQTHQQDLYWEHPRILPYPDRFAQLSCLKAF